MEEDFLIFSRKVLKTSMWYVSRCRTVASVVIVCNERSPLAGIISNFIWKNSIDKCRKKHPFFGLFVFVEELIQPCKWWKTVFYYFVRIINVHYDVY